MPSLHHREILRMILSNPTAVRAERHRRRVRLGTDRDLLAFVEETFGVHIPAVACCPGHVGRWCMNPRACGLQRPALS